MTLIKLRFGTGEWLLRIRRKRGMLDTIKHLGDVSDDREELRRHIFSTYK